MKFSVTHYSTSIVLQVGRRQQLAAEMFGKEIKSLASDFQENVLPVVELLGYALLLQRRQKVAIKVFCRVEVVSCASRTETLASFSSASLSAIAFSAKLVS